MPGRKPFSELQAKMSPEAQARAAEKAAQLENDISLADLRLAMLLSQQELAQTLKISQGSVAKMEKRADMLVGTLRRFIQAMGGDLELVARFPDRTVRIESLGSLSQEAEAQDASQVHA